MEGFEKNPIIRPQAKKNEVFVKRNKPVNVYKKRVEELLNEKVQPIVLHGAGMAIPTVLLLASQYQVLFTNIDIRTSSVTVIDSVESEQRLRTIPALHISLTN